jgi:hypothetical protein
MANEPRGAGSAGGLLFLALLLFLGYLLITAVAGVLQLILGAGFLIVVVVLGLSVLKRR